MAYCTWTDVTNILERASDIVSNSGSQTTLLTEASELADTYLAPLMHTPVELEADGGYPRLVVTFTAHLAADMVAKRRYHGDEDIFTLEYDDLQFTGTKWGHMAMSLLQARRQAKAAVDADVTGPEVDEPRLVTAWSTTNGIVQAMFSAGFFEDEASGTFKFTISSAAGTVAGEDLTIDCTRDNEEVIWTDQAITGTGWYSVAHGLLVRFIDADASPVWTQDDTFTLYCESKTAKPLTEGVGTVEWDLG